MPKSFGMPLLLIALGSVWFLKSTALLPNTATLLALLLAGCGLLLLVLEGVNKSSIVSSPLLMYTGAAIWVYDHYGVRFSHVFSLGMVLAGLLMLLAHNRRIPERQTPRGGRKGPPAEH